MNTHTRHVTSCIEPLEARIAPAAALDALTAKLVQYAVDVGATAAATISTNTLTAKADNLVYAVYDVLHDGTYTSPTGGSEAVELLEAALAPVNGKVRADKDKIAPRLVAAAIVGGDVDDNPDDIADILASVLNANKTTGNVRFQLTAAGKAAAVGQALKSAVGEDASDEIADALLNSVFPTIVPNADVQKFVIASLKTLENDAHQVKSFVREMFGAIGGTAGDEDSIFASNLATAVAATAPAVAGEAIGAIVADLGDIEAKAFLRAAITNPKLVKAIGDIVASSLPEITGGIAELTAEFASILKSANLGALASGALRAAETADSSDTTEDILNAALDLTIAKASIRQSFAGQAAVGNGDNGRAAEVATVIADTFAVGLDKMKVGTAIVKAIGTQEPEAAFGVAVNIAESVGTLLTPAAIAANLALAVPTNGVATGAAVAGVVDGTDASSTDSVSISAAAIAKAPKATLGIAQHVSALAEITNKQAFATALAISQMSAASAIAAGVAATDQMHAADIAVAVAQADSKLQSKLLTIAGSVALAVDVEHISEIGQKVGSVLGTGGKLPKLTSIGTLATALGKAINTKPLTGTANRVDEMGELAAALTEAALASSGGADPKVLTGVGTSIFKSLAAALQPNFGARAADLKDAAEDIAGSIAQTISVSTLGSTQKAALLGSGQSLEAALAKGAKTFAIPVKTAFEHVRGANNANIGTLYQDSDPTKNEPVGKNGTPTGTAKYEIGWILDDQESPPAF